MPPATFIPIAEGSDLIVAIGGWVLRQAAADAARIPALGRVSVNISARQIAAGVLPARWTAALAESGLPPERLELELTESLPLAEAPEVAAMLRGLRDRGIALALDDFGAGYASFARLRRLPFTTLKLDHSLVAQPAGGRRRHGDPAGDPRPRPGAGLARGGRGGGAAGAARCLIGLGFEEAQGYLFGRPMPLDELDGGWG